MAINRQWTKREIDVAFAAFEELRVEKDATLSKIASQVEPLLAAVKEPESSAISNRDIYNKFFNEGGKRLGRLPSLARKIVQKGLVIEIPKAKPHRNKRTLVKDSLRQAISASRGGSRASANFGANQTFEAPGQTHKPCPSNARSHTERQMALSKQGEAFTTFTTKAQSSSMSFMHGALPLHQGAGPLTIEGIGDTYGIRVTVETPTPPSTSHKDRQLANDAAAATSFLETPMTSFCRDERYRHHFEEDLEIFATNLVHRERKHVPSHQETARALAIIESRCRRAIDHFMQTRSFTSVTVQHLKDSTVELCRLLVAGERPEEIREGLEVLSSHVRISAASFLLGCAAASIMQWIYLNFQPRLPDIGQSSIWNLLNAVLEKTPHLRRRLVDVLTLEQLEQDLEKECPELSKDYTQRLATVLTNFRDPTPVFEPSDESDNPTNLSRIEHFRLWERNMAEAFEEGRKLRLKHALSPLKYNYSFPAKGQPFSEETMVSVYPEGGREERGQVWLCLSPLIESWDQDMNPDSYTIVARAKVLSSSLK